MVLSIDTSALARTRIDITFVRYALFYVNWLICLLGRQLLVQRLYYLSFYRRKGSLNAASIVHTLHNRSSIGKA